MDEIVQQKDMLSILAGLEKEKGISISRCEIPDTTGSDKYIVLKNRAVELNPLIGAIPAVGTSLLNQHAVEQTAYSITFNGKSILSEQLFQKGNGAYISNLKSSTGNGFGNQTDITPIDFSKEAMANVANITFSLASVATATYYLNEINKRLGAIQEETRSILLFLESDKQAQIQNDIAFLQQIAGDLGSLNGNDSLLHSHLVTVSNIRREQGQNSIFYQRTIKDELTTYAASHKNKKHKKECIEKLRQHYQSYRIGLASYAMARLLEVQLSGHFDAEYVSRLKADLQHRAEEFIEIHDSILNTTYAVSKGSLNSKVGISQSELYEAIGNTMTKVPFDLTNARTHLYTKAGAGKQRVRMQSVSDASSILGETRFIIKGQDKIYSKARFQVIEPFLKVIESMEAIYSNPMKMIVSGNDIYFEITKEPNEPAPKEELLPSDVTSQK